MKRFAILLATTALLSSSLAFAAGVVPPTEVKSRRGTTAQHGNFTGAVAEVTVDTDKHTTVVHDGATKGGFPQAKEADLLAEIAARIAADSAETAARIAMDNWLYQEILLKYGDLVARLGNLPEVYVDTGTFNGPTGRTITLPKTVGAINEYAVAVVPSSRAGAIGDIYLEQTTSNFVVRCAEANTTDTFKVIIFYRDDTNPYGTAIHRKWYVSPLDSITDHCDNTTSGSLAWVVSHISGYYASVELPGNHEYFCGRNYTIPDNIQLIHQRGAVISPVVSTTLTINAPTQWPGGQIYDGEPMLSGNIRFGPANRDSVRPEMFDNVDHWNGLDEAVTALEPTGGTITLGPYVYEATKQIRVHSNRPINLIGNMRPIQPKYDGSALQHNGYIAPRAGVTGTSMILYDGVTTGMAQDDNVTASASGPIIRGLAFYDDGNMTATIDGAAHNPYNCRTIDVIAALEINQFNRGTLEEIYGKCIKGSVVKMTSGWMARMRNLIVQYSGDADESALLIDAIESPSIQNAFLDGCQMEVNFDAPYILVSGDTDAFRISNCGFESKPNWPQSSWPFLVLDVNDPSDENDVTQWKNMISNCHFARNTLVHPYATTGDYAKLIVNGSNAVASNLTFTGNAGYNEGNPLYEGSTDAASIVWRGKTGSLSNIVIQGLGKNDVRKHDIKILNKDISLSNISMRRAGNLYSNSENTVITGLSVYWPETTEHFAVHLAGPQSSLTGFAIREECKEAGSYGSLRTGGVFLDGPNSSVGNGSIFIDDNSSDNATNRPYVYVRAPNCTVTGVSFVDKNDTGGSVSPSAPCLRLQGYGNTITGNSFKNCTNGGVLLDEGAGNVISSNVFQNVQGNNIVLAYVTENHVNHTLVSNNTIYSPGAVHGIYIGDSYNSVIGNNLADISYSGIYEDENATHNTISLNSITGTGASATLITVMSDSIITGNRLMEGASTEMALQSGCDNGTVIYNSNM